MPSRNRYKKEKTGRKSESKRTEERKAQKERKQRMEICDAFYEPYHISLETTHFTDIQMDRYLSSR